MTQLDLYREIRALVNDIQERELLFKVSHFSKLEQIKNTAELPHKIDFRDVPTAANGPAYMLAYEPATL